MKSLLKVVGFERISERYFVRRGVLFRLAKMEEKNNATLYHFHSVLGNTRIVVKTRRGELVWVWETDRPADDVEAWEYIEDFMKKVLLNNGRIVLKGTEDGFTGKLYFSDTLFGECTEPQPTIGAVIWKIAGGVDDVWPLLKRKGETRRKGGGT